MESTSMGCLTNSISRFIHLITCQTSKHMPTQKDFESASTMLKHLKPILDEIDDEKIASDANLWKECEALDASVNATREFMEQWSPKMSNILSVLQSEQFLTKIRSSSLEICCILCRILRTSTNSSGPAGVQHCVQELQSWQPNQVSRHIEQIMESKTDISRSDHLAEIVEFFGLTSNRELLKESIFVEKERMKLHANKCKEDIDQINTIIDLLAFIRDYRLKTGCFETVNGAGVPSYFRCPLSLELMADPVIVASGQTFEKSSIQKWIEQGLRICPKTCQYLSHTNIIPNYTVKQLIANWFEENNLKFPANSGKNNANPEASVPDNLSSQDVIRTDSFRCSVQSSESMSRSSTCQSNHRSPDHSYTHSRTQSVSSAISSSDYTPSAATEISRVSDKLGKMGGVSGEIMSECTGSPVSNSLSGRGSLSTRSNVQTSESNNYVRPCCSTASSELAHDETTTSTHVEKLVEDLKNLSDEVQTAAAAEIRFLAKHNKENRIIIGKCGAIGILISLLHSDVKLTQEHAVTALLNLSLNEENKARIAEIGVIEPLIHVLKSGTDAAKENSAAAFFSISVLEEYKVKIGRSGAVKALVDLLARGTIRGKKDAATALFNLSICHENKARIVQAGAVKYLVELLEPSSGMVDKSVALLANLSTISEGRISIAREGGIPLIVEIVETGSLRGKENAASILLQLCLHSSKLCNLVLQEGAVPPLVALSQAGTPRGKEKAQQLLSHFRNQREGAPGKKKK